MKYYFLNGKNLTEYPEGLEVYIMGWNGDDLPIIAPRHITYTKHLPNAVLARYEMLTPANPQPGEEYLYEGVKVKVLAAPRSGFIEIMLPSGHIQLVGLKEISETGEVK